MTAVTHAKEVLGQLPRNADRLHDALGALISTAEGKDQKHADPHWAGRQEGIREGLSWAMERIEKLKREGETNMDMALTMFHQVGAVYFGDAEWRKKAEQ